MTEGPAGPAKESALAVSLDVSAVPPSPAGAGRYVLDLAAALAERGDVSLTFVARRRDAARWAGVGIGSAVRPVAPGRRPLRLAWEQVRLPRLLARWPVDVHHGPHYTMPERSRRPVVVTVHDCTFFDHPEWHERSKVLVFRRAIAVAARRAAAVVCVSATTAGRLQEVTDVAAPVFVAPHGVDGTRFTPDEPSPGADAAALARLGVDARRPLVVFVGTVEPRKNVPALVSAFAALGGAHPDARLVIAGQPGWGEAAVTESLAAAGPAAGRVVRTGYVEDATVAALLRSAAAVAYPSLAEGYGLPALEALACGAPLVTTAGTAMAEMAGDAAVLVPPGDVDALRAALDGVLAEDPAGERRRARRRLGLTLAAARTWAASADEHVRAYRAAAGR
ncbi:MAG: glycosyltransferase family 4 protein [Acidimicrobiales bacterium]